MSPEPSGRSCSPPEPVSKGSGRIYCGRPPPVYRFWMQKIPARFDEQRSVAGGELDPAVLSEAYCDGAFSALACTDEHAEGVIVHYSRIAVHQLLSVL